MRQPLSIEELAALRVLPPAPGDGWHALARAALDRDGPLALADYLTMRDLLALSGSAGDARLAALILALFVAMHEGSICLGLDERSLAARFGVFLGEEDAMALAKNFAAADLPAAYPLLVTADEDAYLPLVLKTVGAGRFLYFQKFPRYERELKEALGRHLRCGPSAFDSAAAAAAWRAVLVDRPAKIGGRPVLLNNEQRLAVALALVKEFVIVSGGPGTGKTSIVIAIVRCLARLGIRPDEILLAAPTGRAAMRLADAVAGGVRALGTRALRIDAALAEVTQGTIHRLLGYDPVRGTFRHHAGNPLPARLIIVDEVSMVDVVLMARLFAALTPGTRVILLGDKDQLPSVEAGAVLADLMPRGETAVFSRATADLLLQVDPSLCVAADASAGGAAVLTDRVVILRESYRSGRAIIAAAGQINAQDGTLADTIPALPVSLKRTTAGQPRRVVGWPSAGEEGVFFLEGGGDDLDGWRGVLDAWISRRYLSPHATRPDMTMTYAELIRSSAKRAPVRGAFDDPDKTIARIFAYIDDGIILTLVRKGPFGAWWVNRHLANRLATACDRPSYGGAFAGAPVMIVQNDPASGLCNGDIGVILKASDGTSYGVFRRSGAFFALPFAELPRWEFAFAVTVHKSQGSEYGTVLLVLPSDIRNRLLTKEIVYTALTRARQAAVVYGARDVLKAAIGRSIVRQSGLRLWE